MVLELSNFKKRNKLLGHGYDVPVVDPTLAAVKLLEVYGQSGLKPSKLTYMPIREKRGYDLQGKKLGQRFYPLPTFL